jgi:hypothetical protein
MSNTPLPPKSNHMLSWVLPCSATGRELFVIIMEMRACCGYLQVYLGGVLHG